MTVQSLYHYFDSRDALLTVLVADAHHAARRRRAGRGRRDPRAGPPRAAARGHRRVPRLGARQPAGVPAALRHAGARFRAPRRGDRSGRRRAGWAEPVPRGRLRRLDPRAARGACRSRRAPSCRTGRGEMPLPPGALALFLELRARMHGLVMLELLGHLHLFTGHGRRCSRAAMRADVRRASTRSAAGRERVGLVAGKNRAAPGCSGTGWVPIAARGSMVRAAWAAPASCSWAANMAPARACARSSGIAAPTSSTLRTSSVVTGSGDPVGRRRAPCPARTPGSGRAARRARGSRSSSRIGSARGQRRRSPAWAARRTRRTRRSPRVRSAATELVEPELGRPHVGLRGQPGRRRAAARAIEATPESRPRSTPARPAGRRRADRRAGRARRRARRRRRSRASARGDADPGACRQLVGGRVDLAEHDVGRARSASSGRLASEPAVDSTSGAVGEAEPLLPRLGQRRAEVEVDARPCRPWRCVAGGSANGVPQPGSAASGRGGTRGAGQPAAPAGRVRAPLRASCRARRSGSSTARASTLTGVTRSYTIRTYGCQMNVHDSERMAGLLEAGGLRAGGRPRRRRRRRVQHLRGPRERRQQALRQPRPPAAGQGREPGHADRRRRLPGAEGPRRDRPPGAVGGRRVRHAQRARAARAAGARPAQRGGAGGDRRVAGGVPLHAAGPPRVGLRRLGVDLGGLQQHLHVLHRPVAARHGDATAAPATCSPRSRRWPPRACWR